MGPLMDSFQLVHDLQESYSELALRIDYLENSLILALLFFCPFDYEDIK